MSQHMIKNYRLFSILGILGGVSFFAANAFLFLTPHFDLQNASRADWASMDASRFINSMILGMGGAILLLFGFYAMFRAVDNVCPQWQKRLWLLGGIGTAFSAFSHFVFGCLQPLQVKAMLAATKALPGTEIPQEYLDFVLAEQEGWSNLVTGVTFGFLVVQCIAYICIILGGKLGVPKWLALLNFLSMGILGFLLGLALRNTPLAGLTPGLEGLGYGLIYIASLLFWLRYSEEQPQPAPAPTDV